MSNGQQAQRGHLKSIQQKTGKSLAELAAVVRRSRIKQQGQLRTMVMRKWGLSYSDANALVHVAQEAPKKPVKEKKPEDPLDKFYSGAKAPLRPIHEAITREVSRFGEFECVPEKGYISLRRKKQFLMLRPTRNKQLELGLNVKDLPPAIRLQEQPRGSEVNYLVRLSDPIEVNAEIIAWMKFAYEIADE